MACGLARPRSLAWAGGECVETLFRSLLGQSLPLNVIVTHTDSSLTATVTPQDNRPFSCSYSGTAGSTSLTLNLTGCEAETVANVQCAGGVLRDRRLNASSITGTVSGNRVSGTLADSWHISVAGSAEGVGTLILDSTFVMTRVG